MEKFFPCLFKNSLGLYAGLIFVSGLDFQVVLVIGLIVINKLA